MGRDRVDRDSQKTRRWEVRKFELPRATSEGDQHVVVSDAIFEVIYKGVSTTPRPRTDGGRSSQKRDAGVNLWHRACTTLRYHLGKRSNSWSLFRAHCCAASLVASFGEAKCIDERLNAVFW